MSAELVNMMPMTRLSSAVEISTLSTCALCSVGVSVFSHSCIYGVFIRFSLFSGFSGFCVFIICSVGFLVFVCSLCSVGLVDFVCSSCSASSVFAIQYINCFC
jgi:hypothetical protein